MEHAGKSSITYIIGIPGSGKSTAVARALKDDKIAQETKKPIPYIEYASGLLQIGRNRETYPGTDVLSYNAQPKILNWLDSLPDAVRVVAEGDRLANGKFFNALLGSGWDLKIIHLYCPPKVAIQRCIARGSTYKTPWYQGRVTKVDNLVAHFIDHVFLTLDSRWEPELLAGEIKNHLG
jgi:hypothetical protein